MSREPRIAFFTDSFHDVNGVAHTSRHLEAFACRNEYPILSVHSGQSALEKMEGSCQTLELQRSRFRIPLDEGLAFDPWIFRYWSRVFQACDRFQPNVVHITGPGDIGLLGAMIAWRNQIPLVASWHTNLHEYAARRWPLPVLGDSIQKISWKVLTRFYGFARVGLAPNEELRAMLADQTNRPVYLMERGIDTELFSPQRRQRQDNQLVIGYVGRLRPEKNVQLLAQVEQALIQAGLNNFRFLLIGEGNQRSWLQDSMRFATLPGVMHGIELAESYASMDLFLFPSWTDTYGNVIAEALASGVPAVVTSGGGPKFLVQDGKSGIVAGSDDEFIRRTVDLVRNRQQIELMRKPAREWALERSWEGVFQNVWECYCRALGLSTAKSPKTQLAGLKGKVQHLPR